MIATIFDIDGTLVESSDFDGDCYFSAIRNVGSCKDCVLMKMSNPRGDCLR